MRFPWNVIWFLITLFPRLMQMTHQYAYLHKSPRIRTQANGGEWLWGPREHRCTAAASLENPEIHCVPKPQRHRDGNRSLRDASERSLHLAPARDCVAARHWLIAKRECRTPARQTIFCYELLAGAYGRVFFPLAASFWSARRQFGFRAVSDCGAAIVRTLFLSLPHSRTMHFGTTPTWKLATHLLKPSTALRVKALFCSTRLWEKGAPMLSWESHKNANKIFSFTKRFLECTACLFCAMAQRCENICPWFFSILFN